MPIMISLTESYSKLDGQYRPVDVNVNHIVWMHETESHTTFIRMVTNEAIIVKEPREQILALIEKNRIEQ